MSDNKVPEKFAKLLLDEPKIADEVIKMGNIYYLYSWLDKNRHHLVFFPDGEMKSVFIPLYACNFKKFGEFIGSIRKDFTLISGGEPLTTDFYPDGRLIYMDEIHRKLAERPFPIVRVVIFLKQLKGFIELAVKNGFISAEGGGKNKEHRTVIMDSGQGIGMSVYTGVPERGFEWFCVDTGEKRDANQLNL